MLEEKKAVLCELRHVEKMMVDVEKRLTYLLREFMVDDSESEPAMGAVNYGALAGALMEVHKGTVLGREIMVASQVGLQSQWGK